MLQLTLATPLALVAVILWLPFISELLCIFRRHGAREQRPEVSAPPRLLVLVPAHNEELLITGCVRSLIGMSYPESARKVCVIADNCSDATARLAAAEGATVMERFDPAFPGKPRAIAWALTQIQLQDWDACVIIDADSTVAPDFAAGVARLAPLNDVIFQANFGVLNEFESWLTRLGGLLSRCRYEVTYPLKQTAGLNCPVTGNGMGFGTNLLMRDGWSSFSITEDSELYAIYTARGVRIHHAREATLFSQEARSLRQGSVQRRRWLGGRLRVIRDQGPSILRSSAIGWHQKLDAFAELGLSTPVLHLILAGSVASFAFIAFPGRLGLSISLFAMASLSGIAGTAVAALIRHPQPWRTVIAFLMLPVYTAWRASVLCSTLLTLRDTTWRRTERSAPTVRVATPNA